MKKSYIGLKIEEFKQKFSNFIQHRKKVKALENLSSCNKNINSNYVQLLRQCVESGFLEEPEEKFLDHMLTKFQLEMQYLTWCHRTKWVKRQIFEMKEAAREVNEQLYIDFGKLDQAVKTPQGFYPEISINQQKVARV